MSALAGYQGALLVTAPPSVSLPANMALVDSGDHQTFSVGAGNATYRYWDNTATFTFQTAPDGTTWTNATPTTVQYVSGKVVFAAPVTGATPSARVTAGKYFSYALLANVTGWTFDGQMAFGETTSLSGAIGGGSGSPAKTFQPLLLEGTIALTKFWVPESSVGFFAYVTGGTPLIVSCVAGTGNRYEGYVFTQKLGIKTDVSKLVEETLDFRINGNLYAV